jgi:hypothetical protein
MNSQTAKPIHVKVLSPLCCLFLFSFLCNQYLLLRFQDTDYNNSTHDENLLPPNQQKLNDFKMRGAFVHIGKTGGSSLTKLLANGCHSFIEKPCRNVTSESVISKQTTYFHTPDFELGGLINRSFDFYVITLRDPLSRTISSYRHSHPDNQLVWLFDEVKQTPHYKEQVEKFGEIHNLIWKKRAEVTLEPYKELYKCFPTLQDFSMQLTVNIQREDILDKKNCSNVASLALQHRVPLLEHLFWDIRKVVSQIDLKPEAELVVLRTEYLLNDWLTGNYYLGGLHLGNEFGEILRNSSNYPVQKKVDREGRLRLCAAIQEEYIIYFELLWRAKNLNRDDIKDCMKRAKTLCPNVTISTPFSN